MKFGLIGETNRYTTIPNHTGDLPEKTLRAILKSCGIEEPKNLLTVLINWMRSRLSNKEAGVLKVDIYN